MSREEPGALIAYGESIIVGWKPALHPAFSPVQDHTPSRKLFKDHLSGTASGSGAQDCADKPWSACSRKGLPSLPDLLFFVVSFGA